MACWTYNICRRIVLFIAQGYLVQGRAYFYVGVFIGGRDDVAWFAIWEFVLAYSFVWMGFFCREYARMPLDRLEATNNTNNCLVCYFTIKWVYEKNIFEKNE